MTEKLPDFIYAGTSRSGSTWTYSSLKEHRDIYMPDRDPVNFFDIEYYRGMDWYEDLFKDADANQTIGESSPGYMKNVHAPERISEELGEVKLIFCLRNPVERAFSEWWQGKSFGWHNMEFEGSLSHHTAYDMWVSPGFYDNYLDRFDEHFDGSQMKILLFDDLKNDSGSFANELYDFIGVDSDFIPSLVGERSNQAATFAPRLKKWGYQNVPDSLNELLLKRLYYSIDELTKSEYEKGMSDEMRRNLEEVYAEDIRSLSDRIDRDLSHWMTAVDL